MKHIVTKAITLILFTFLLCPKVPAKEKQAKMVAYPMLEKPVSKMFSDWDLKLLNETIDGFIVKDLTPQEIIDALTAKVGKEVKYGQYFQIRLHQEIVAKKITWNLLPPMKVGDIIGKLSSEIGGEWHCLGASFAFINNQKCLTPYHERNYNVSPSLIKVVLNFPFLETNKTKFRKVPLKSENLKKGFERLGILFPEFQVLPFVGYQRPKENVKFEFDVTTKKLKVLSCSSVHTQLAHQRLERLLSSYQKYGGWKSFYRYLYFEKALESIAVSENFNSITAAEAIKKLEEGTAKSASKYKGIIKWKNELSPEKNNKVLSVSFSNAPLSSALQYISMSAQVGYKVENETIIFIDK